MHQILRALFLLLLLPAWAGAANPDRLSLGSAHRLHSTVLDEDREYQVYLPRSYDWALDRRYPILLVLDGETNFMHSASSVEYLAAQNEIPEMIVVGLSSTVRIRDYTQSDWAEAWVGGGGAANFRRFLSDEFLPEIDRSYRSNGFRVLSGHSASGQFVLHCLSTQPQLFHGWFAISPSLNWDHELPQRELEPALQVDGRPAGFVYLARSDDAGRALADYDRVVQTLQIHAPRGLRWRSTAFPTETHSGVTLLAQIDALRQLYSGYRLHNDVMDQGFEYIEAHFARASQIVGHDLPVPESVVNELAYSALQSDQIDTALALFQKNADANPNSANALDGLTDAYAKAARWTDAAATATRALALAQKFNHSNRSYFEQQLHKMQAKLQAESGD